MRPIVPILFKTATNSSPACHTLTLLYLLYIFHSTYHLLTYSIIYLFIMHTVYCLPHPYYQVAQCKESTCQCRTHWFDPWVEKIPWRREWQPTPVFLPGESHGQETGRLQSMQSQRVRHNLATEPPTRIHTTIP